FTNERRATLAAEGKVGGVGKATLGASRVKRDATLPAKTHALGIIKAAARTAHGASLLLRASQGKKNARLRGLTTTGRVPDNSPHARRQRRHTAHRDPQTGRHHVYRHCGLQPPDGC